MFISNFAPDDRVGMKKSYLAARDQTVNLAVPLSVEDQTIQTMQDVSPTKWHLAHTSWFFDTFILKPFFPSHQSQTEGKFSAYNYLFNSYYEQIGDKWPRAERGLLSRPSVSEVHDYRLYIDQKMSQLIDEASTKNWREISPLILLGLSHEWQHQELLLTDIKHVIAHNPLRPAIYQKAAKAERADTRPSPSKWAAFDGGLHELGCAEQEQDFCFDNETPVHKKFIPPFALAETLVTNRDYRQFMEDGGYETSALWLSDGWQTKQKEQWKAPLYWQKSGDNHWTEFTLAGEQKIDDDAPVVHLSYYEAAAYAAWRGKRLPREEEIEIVSKTLPICGNLGHMVKDGEALAVHPAPAQGKGLRQIYGDVWEWTQSPYMAYPGYRAAKGAIGEYNGKFMCNQFVLKGGSCATVKEQMRPSYRNFFPPEARWQFSGLRLAEDR